MEDRTLQQVTVKKDPTYSQQRPNLQYNIAIRRSSTGSMFGRPTRCCQQPQQSVGEEAELPLLAIARVKQHKRCSVHGCASYGRIRGFCKKHGGVRYCTIPTCPNKSRTRGLCIRHGGGSRCQQTGCALAAQTKGYCKTHGGAYIYHYRFASHIHSASGGQECSMDGCTKRAHLKGVCRMHGGGLRCKRIDCGKWAQLYGLCVAHATTQRDRSWNG